MAKCLKEVKTGKIKRFTENNKNEVNKVIDLVKTGIWSYVPKKEWKSLRPEPKDKKENKENKDNKKKNK